MVKTANWKQFDKNNQDRRKYNSQIELEKSSEQFKKKV